MSNAITLSLIVLALISSQAVRAYSERDVAKLKALNSCMRCNLTGADLSDLNFDGAEFEETFFVGVNASRSTFKGASFSASAFEYTDLTNSSFESIDGSLHVYSSDLTGAKIQGGAGGLVFIDPSNLSKAKITNVETLFLEIKKPEVGHLIYFKDYCQIQDKECDDRKKFSVGRVITRMIMNETDFSGSEIHGNLTDADFSSAILRNTKIHSSAILCRTKFPWGVENRDCGKSENEKRDEGYYLDQLAKRFTSKDESIAWDKIEKDGTTLNQLLVAILYKPNLDKMIPMFQAAFEQRLNQARVKRAEAEEAKRKAKEAADEAALLQAKKAAEELRKYKSNIEPSVQLIRNHISSCWTPPMSIIGAKKMTVSILVKIDPKGKLSTAEILEKGEMAWDRKFKAFADEALRAVYKCSPFPVPSIGYEFWKEITVTFDYSSMK